MVRLNTLLDMLEGDPDDSFVRYALAKEYENMESWPEALSHYLIIKEKDPDYIGMYYHLAKLYEYLQETDKALTTYDEGISIAKKIPDFHALSELNSAKLNLEMEL